MIEENSLHYRIPNSIEGQSIHLVAITIIMLNNGTIYNDTKLALCSIVYHTITLNSMPMMILQDNRGVLTTCFAFSLSERKALFYGAGSLSFLQ